MVIGPHWKCPFDPYKYLYPHSSSIHNTFSIFPKMFQSLSSSFALSSPPIHFRAGSAPSMSCSRNPCHASMPTLVEATRKPSSLYEVLRVKQTASPTEIKTAYRSLAKMYHPDASPVDSDGRNFIQIHNAYETLSDPAARAVYDLSLGSTGRRPYAYACSSGGVRGRSAHYSTRRWETDQCW